MPEPLPSDLQHRPFRVSEALALGVGRGRLERADLRADFYGVRAPRSARTDVESLCRAYATRLGRHRYFSHETAAVLWNMRLPLEVEASRVVHVTTVLPARTPRARGIVGHHADAPGHELVEHRGFLLPRPAETWRMLSSRMSVEALVVAGDGLVARRHPLATMAQLRRAVARHVGQRGNARLRCALELVRPGADSPQETRLRLIIVAGGLPEPAVNALVSAPGAPARFGDLVYPEWRVIVEYEGEHHQTSRAAYLGDIGRFEQLGGEWRIVRITKEHTRAVVVARVESALRAAGWPP